MRCEGHPENRKCCDNTVRFITLFENFSCVMLVRNIGGPSATAPVTKNTTASESAANGARPKDTSHSKKSVDDNLLEASSDNVHGPGREDAGKVDTEQPSSHRSKQ